MRFVSLFHFLTENYHRIVIKIKSVKNNQSSRYFKYLLRLDEQTSDIYEFIGEPKSCSHFITNGAKLRLSYKYIHIRSLIITIEN